MVRVREYQPPLAQNLGERRDGGQESKKKAFVRLVSAFEALAVLKKKFQNCTVFIHTFLREIYSYIFVNRNRLVSYSVRVVSRSIVVRVACGYGLERTG